MPGFNMEQYSPYMSEADLAHAILKAAGAPLYFRDLLEQVMAIKPVSGRDREHIMAGIHTDLNLDGRFIHVGKGVWGLREWMHDRKAFQYEHDEELDN
ncbi:DNA-directed RNA polymerase subunit delta [Phosphitispora fastidiosa]|uniref:DNA-directed RNA polymerase subunit delta n=1 Tax=Phosphitispora fastidiosa TaxID=2837202 RepID=UPI001E5396F2|nr:DNA-directed RNA polymerase subunit delta [Phosphitispora fastidiosa]MBU7007333.1 DNA-directed RNA polymerase subunit delta [Phosphitispora fastidiosa]